MSGVAKSREGPDEDEERARDVAGVIEGQRHRPELRHPRAPTLSAASSSEGSILPRASTTLR